ncbi:MAG: SUMF1/EgtB/PvdO family nonheme iron enzyme [Acidobacteria bacterium]|nr:SUMF1/EgtB/PvdO family nonheme iron enzyme [Acidobacteriota bacterium]
MLESGGVLKDRYLIEKHLGKGGMGAVYLAIDQTFGSKVAVKETIVHGRGLEEAFEREARVLNRLRHGAIPVVMDYFIEGEGRFLIMQYIPGDDLSTLSERSKRPFQPETVLDWADKLCDALTYLHTQDPPIIHRDIKPQNLKLTDRHEVVLLDFGLSKASVGEGEKSQSIFGYTPCYAPLEQVQGEGTDARSDIYSLAATLYRLLTGNKPIDAVTRATKNPDPLLPIHQISPAMSRQVSDVIMRALSIHAEDRYATAADFRSALRGAAFDDLLLLAQGFGDADSGSGTQVAGSGSSGTLPSRPVPDIAPLPGIVAHPASEAPTVVNPKAGDNALPTVVTPKAGDNTLPTVVTPGGVGAAGFSTADGGARPAPAGDSVTGDFDPVPNSDGAAPAVRNLSAPATVSFVFETETLGNDGTSGKREKKRGKQYFEAAGGSLTIPMVAIPAGEFAFGSSSDEPEREPSEGPQATVSIESFFIGRTPITQAQYAAVATQLPRVRINLDPDPSAFKGDDRPVECVSWEEAVEFCNRLERHSGREYRLPSEQEWEYACRAGSDSPFAFGPTLTVDVANVDGTMGYAEGPEGEGRGETSPVGTVGFANRFGLSDMHGNVWEWTADQWHDTLDGAPSDGSARSNDSNPTVRVIRGGSWNTIAADARSARRFGFLQRGRQNDVGFRIAFVAGDGR